MSDGENGVVLDRRVIPVSSSISREAADALRAMTGDDCVPLNARCRLSRAETTRRGRR